jgi:single-strand DNA-binding protein
MNKILLFGRLGRSPDLRVEHPVCRFSLAVHEPYIDRDTGERIKRVTWFQVVAWNRLSEIASQYLKKGDQVLVEGRVQLREFKGRDGNQHAMLQVTASRIEFGAKAARDTGVSNTAHEISEDFSEGNDFSSEAAEQAEPGEAPDDPAAIDTAESFVADDDIPW